MYTKAATTGFLGTGAGLGFTGFDGPSLLGITVLVLTVGFAVLAVREVLPKRRAARKMKAVSA